MNKIRLTEDFDCRDGMKDRDSVKLVVKTRIDSASPAIKSKMTVSIKMLKVKG